MLNESDGFFQENSVLDSNGALAVSGARVVDQITGVGFGVTILIIALAFAVFANYLQFRRNNSLVDKMFDVIPNQTAAVLKAVADFKEATIGICRKT